MSSLYITLLKMSPKNNDIVRNELDIVFKARTVTSAASAWSFPVVVATKKDGKPRFCVDYRMMIQLMKVERFLLP